MHPILILLIGVAIVIGGVLALRLHAFLALVLAALAVGFLTPHVAVLRFEAETRAVPFSRESPGAPVGVLLKKDHGVRVGELFVTLRQETAEDRLSEVAVLRVAQITEEEEGRFRGTLEVVEGDPSAPLDGDLVIQPAFWRDARQAADLTVGERVATAFGGTCSKIAILIAMAAIIGKCLLDSGAADRIVRAGLKVLGERGAPLAFLGSGFLLGIPVFFDTVFYLMMPLGKAMRMRTGRNYLLYILTIVAGATMAHSLVPPTPGPLLVANELDVDLGLMILAGCVVGLFTSTAGYFYAQYVNRRAEVPLRESPDFSLAELEQIARRDERELPALSISLLPILLPVVLISGHTVLKSASAELPESVMQLAATLGNKNIALTLATAIAMATLVWQKRTRLKDLAIAVQAALASGGVIILITAGGGAFGGMLKQTGVAGLIGQLSPGSPQLVIVLAFLITTAIRTAQGSATVAMITSVGVLTGFSSAEVLGCHPVYLALAIGCGSKPIAWMNDSGFWVICKMSGMTEAEGLKFVTPMSILMGTVGLVATLIAATLFPLA